MDEEELMEQYVDLNRTDYDSFTFEYGLHQDDDGPDAVFRFCTEYDEDGFNKYKYEVLKDGED